MADACGKGVVGVCEAIRHGRGGKSETVTDGVVVLAATDHDTDGVVVASRRSLSSTKAM